MKKLTYEKYKGNEEILIIDLGNDYIIMAIKSFNKENHDYSVDFYIREKNTYQWDIIEKMESKEFKCGRKIINSLILKEVAKAFESGFFDYYIERYEYQQKCFNIGNSQLEHKRMEEKYVQRL